MLEILINVNIIFEVLEGSKILSCSIFFMVQELSEIVWRDFGDWCKKLLSNNYFLEFFNIELQTTL